MPPCGLGHPTPPARPSRWGSWTDRDTMASEHCFDVVSKVNLQEVRNAIAQAQKEIGTRFDFRGTQAGVEFEEAGGLLKITADHQAQLRSVVDVVDGKLAKRGVPLKALDRKSV